MEKHNFKVGDIVRYTYDGRTGRSDWNGKTGRVHAIGVSAIEVHWNDGGRGFINTPSRLSHALKVGDHVKIVANGKQYQFKPDFDNSWTPSMDKMVNDGKIYYVTDISVMGVRIQHPGSSKWLPSFPPQVLQVVDPEEDEVDKALAVLKRHGEVTFKPTFKPITVKLNDVHAAIVTDKEVKVGCQTFKFEAIVRLMEAVSKAMAHR